MEKKFFRKKVALKKEDKKRWKSKQGRDLIHLKKNYLCALP
jgi:hypothetical protein